MRFRPQDAGVSVPVDHLLHRATIAVLKQRHPGRELTHEDYEEYLATRQKILRQWLWTEGK